MTSVISSHPPAGSSSASLAGDTRECADAPAIVRTGADPTPPEGPPPAPGDGAAAVWEPHAEPTDETKGTSVMTEIHEGRLTCDRCIAHAAFLTVLRGGGELLFCGHHLREHRERLLAGGAQVWPLPGRGAPRPVRDAA